MADNKISVNRAPVLTLWAAVVAERLGYDSDEALSLAKAVASLNAQAKGRSLGIFGPRSAGEGAAAEGAKGEGSPGEGQAVGRRLPDEYRVDLCGRPVPAVRTERGVRAVSGDQFIEPEPVRKYLAARFGADLDRVRGALETLAAVYAPDELRGAAYGLYEAFRPKIASGKRGWGQKGDLDLDVVQRLAQRKSDPLPF